MHGLVTSVEEADADNDLSYHARCIRESVCGVKAAEHKRLRMNEKLPVAI